MSMVYQIAQNFYNALMSDIAPSLAQKADYGIDIATDPQGLLTAYQNAVRTGKVTLEQLSDALGDGPALTALIGVPITTIWDSLPPEE